MATRVGYFEMISTYFVKIYYNYLYDTALKKAQNSKDISTTLPDEYRNALRAFKEALSTSQKYYYDTVKDLWQTFQLISPITLPDFIDTVVKLFIPDSFHSELINEKLRDRYMANLLLTIVSDFSSRINALYVDKIISEKERSKSLINTLQDDFNSILENIRTNMHQKLTEKSVQSNTMMPVDAFNKMKNLLLLAKEAKDNLEAENHELNGRFSKLTAEYKKRLAALESENKALKAEVERLKAVPVREEPKPTKTEPKESRKQRIPEPAPEQPKKTKEPVPVPVQAASSFIEDDAASDTSDTPTVQQIIAKRKNNKT